ncbi:MAG: aminotransferase class V-fold PLP-dependent enzyme [Planctomycetota bacterium]|jgi:isopenicillin-N epimerase
MHWSLDPEITFLNHGSFGACPIPILEEQDHWRRRLEREPMAFFLREYEQALDNARSALANLVGAPAEDIAFVINATTGVNAVVRSLRFQPGDEILTVDHAYNACKNALHFAAERCGAKVVIVDTPFPVEGPEQCVQAILDKTSTKTKLAMVDHIASPTGMVMPIDEIVKCLEAEGIDTLVDGAHAAGQVDLNITELAPTHYTGNCHKWLCTPKGSGFLYVRRDLQEQIRPTVISHGANSPRTDRSRFLLEFDWPGTQDPSAFLTIPRAIEFLSTLLPGGLPGLRQHNKDLVLKGRAMLCEVLGINPPCPESMVGFMAAVPMPDAETSDRPDPLAIDPLQERLFQEHRIEVPVTSWPAPPKRVLRISAQHYNEEPQYRQLADALRTLLA